MKKFTQFAIMAGLLFIMSSGANAWDVYINNTTDHIVTVEIKGEHLFWRQVDCVKTLQPHSDGTCTMPGLICPVSATATFTTSKGTNTTEFTGLGAMCYNTLMFLFQNAGQTPSARWAAR